MSLAIAIFCRWLLVFIVAGFCLFFVGALIHEAYCERRDRHNKRIDRLMRIGMRRANQLGWLDKDLK